VNPVSETVNVGMCELVEGDGVRGAAEGVGRGRFCRGEGDYDGDNSSS